MGKKLVIVESPAKAKTISRFLGDDFIVEASVGHVRDLPRNAKEIPEKFKGRSWSSLGVNVEDGFTPIYVVSEDRRRHIRKLKEALKTAEAVYLATDEDREGESISWHLLELLRPKVPVHRLVFHEITQNAIERALQNVRALDLDLVHAQETRRIVDRLFGYKVSPVLWKKVQRGTSAGRVQSVSVRLIVERERARQAHVSAEWWDVGASFENPQGPSFSGKLVGWKQRSIATGQDFTDRGELKENRVERLVLSQEDAEELVSTVERLPATVQSIVERPFTERPSAPFITSTLQQEANRKLGFTTKRTMSIAQQLYENGWITYMRTDSTTLSSQAVQAARQAIADTYGENYLPAAPVQYRSKSKNAQEAHEAIRPSGEQFRSLEEAMLQLESDQMKLYRLIWCRTMASQMKPAKGKRLRADVHIGEAVFAVTGKAYTFDGFRKAYVLGSESSQKGPGVLPVLSEQQVLTIEQLIANEHHTKPPARLTEASLVSALEERGIGRPSTYASIIDTILRRRYVIKKGNAILPTFLGISVTCLLEENLSWLIEYNFTARMEAQLDEIAAGQLEQLECLNQFYFGERGLQQSINVLMENIDAREVPGIPLGEIDGSLVQIKVGQYGAYVSNGETNADLPEDSTIDSVTLDLAQELIEQRIAGPQLLGVDTETEDNIYLANGRYGYYVQRGEPKEVPKARGKGTKTIQPKRSSLLDGMVAEEMDLATALRLLTLPRELGEHTVGEVTEKIVAANGRFGPYVSWAGTSASIPRNGPSVLDVTLEEAVALLQTKMQRNRVLGTQDDKIIQLKSSRWGLFVTDGDKRVSLAKGTVAAEVTLADALDALSKSSNRTKKSSGKKKSTKAASRRSSSPAPRSKSPSTPAATRKRKKPTIKLKREK